MRRLLLALLFLASCACAQERTTLVVPYPAGGLVDVVARYLAERAGHAVVENRTGGVGLIAAAYVESSAPDGRTAMVGAVTPNAIDPGWSREPADERNLRLVPAAIIAGFPHVLVASRGSGLRTTPEALAALRHGAHYATEGLGSFPHLIIRSIAPEGVPVHYRGAPDALRDVAAGIVPIGLLAGMPALQWRDRLTILGQLPAERVGGAFSEIPTLREQGVPLSAVAWIGLFFPERTPRAQLELWNARVASAAGGPWFEANGLTVMRMSVEQAREFVAAERARYRALARASDG